MSTRLAETENVKYILGEKYVMFERISSANTFEPFGELSNIIGGIREGDTAGVIVTDQLSHAYFLHLALSNFQGNSYYLDVSSRVSPQIVSSLGGNPDMVFFGKVYSINDVFSALNYVQPGSLLIVGSLNLLNPSTEDVLNLRKIVHEKGLFAIVLVEEQALNELDLLGESRRLLLIPELYEQVLIGRINHYRGKYKLTVTVLRNYPEKLDSLGDHEIVIDEEVRKILSLGTEGQ